jgi:hypothetical protein
MIQGGLSAAFVLLVHATGNATNQQLFDLAIVVQTPNAHFNGDKCGFCGVQIIIFYGGAAWTWCGPDSIPKDVKTIQV